MLFIKTLLTTYIIYKFVSVPIYNHFLKENFMKSLLNYIRNFVIIFLIVTFIILCINKFNFNEINTELSSLKTNWSNIYNKNLKISDVFQKCFQDYFDLNMRMLNKDLEKIKNYMNKNKTYLPSTKDVKKSFDLPLSSTWNIRRSVNVMIFSVFCMFFFYVYSKRILIANILFFLFDVFCRLIWFPFMKLKCDFWYYLNEWGIIKNIVINYKIIKIEDWIEQLKLHYNNSKNWYDSHIVEHYRLIEIQTINKNANNRYKTYFEYDWKKDPINNDPDVLDKMYNDIKYTLYTKYVGNVPQHCEDNEYSKLKHWDFWEKIFNNESIKQAWEECLDGPFIKYITQEPIFQYFVGAINGIIIDVAKLLKDWSIINDSIFLKVLHHLNLSYDCDLTTGIFTILFYLFLYMNVLYCVLFFKSLLDWNSQILLLINDMLLFINIDNFIMRFFAITIIIIVLFIIIWQFVFLWFLKKVINLLIYIFNIINDIIIFILDKTLWSFFENHFYSKTSHYYRINYYLMWFFWKTKPEYILIFFQLFLMLLFSLFIRFILILEYVVKVIFIFSMTIYIFLFLKMLMAIFMCDLSDFFINFTIYISILYVSFKLLFKDSFILMEKLYDEWKRIEKDHELFRSRWIDDLFQKYKKRV